MPGNTRILAVDDEAFLVQFYKAVLGLPGGYNPQQLKGLRDPGCAAALRSGDHLPDHARGYLGRELVLWFLAIRPDLPIILCTGLSFLVDEQTVAELGIRRFLV